jgi:hypothetical protein
MFVREGNGHFKDNAVYIPNGAFATATGSVGGKDVSAGREMKIGAYPGFGTGTSSIWYSSAGRDGARAAKANAVYLRTGHFSVKGSLSSGDDLLAGEKVILEAFPNYGKGTASMWFSKIGKGKINSNTVYLEQGDLRTEVGNVDSAKDISSKKFRIRSSKFYGEGEASLVYSSRGSAKYRQNTLYASSGFEAQEGSIEAKKSLVTGRHLEIKAYPGFGSGAAKLWYSQRAPDSDSGYDDSGSTYTGSRFQDKERLLLQWPWNSSAS